MASVQNLQEKLSRRDCYSIPRPRSRKPKTHAVAFAQKSTTSDGGSCYDGDHHYGDGDDHGEDEDDD